MLKRFNKKYSKTRRRAFTRLRHDANLYLLHTIIKYWIKDYNFSKHRNRIQYSNGFFVNNFLFFNYSFITNKNLNIFYNWNFYFLNFSKKYTYSSLTISKKFNAKLKPQKQQTITSKAWTLPNLMHETNELVSISYSEHDNLFYAFAHLPSFMDISFLFKHLTNRQIFLKLQEIYKIIIFQFYFSNFLY